MFVWAEGYKVVRMMPIALEKEDEGSELIDIVALT